jgi:hypothetical protein
MQFFCDAPPYTWFRLETAAEAQRESQDMGHAVERFFRQAEEQAIHSYVPPSDARYIEQSIGRKDHVRRAMPRFLTLRDGEGKGLVTAMLPPEGVGVKAFRPIIVGFENSDPYEHYADEIAVLARHVALPLERARCYPYHRS